MTAVQERRSQGGTIEIVDGCVCLDLAGVPAMPAELLSGAQKARCTYPVKAITLLQAVRCTVCEQDHLLFVDYYQVGDSAAEAEYVKQVFFFRECGFRRAFLTWLLGCGGVGVDIVVVSTKKDFKPLT